MIKWALALSISCLVTCLGCTSAQEVWSDTGNGDDPNELAVETFYRALAGPNALSRSTMLDRQERLQYKCDQLTRDRPLDQIQDPEAFRNLLVDDKHKLLYCYVPKVKKHSVSNLFSSYSNARDYLRPNSP